jgi:two-component system, OmpR family, sensor histidine kinase QseC
MKSIRIYLLLALIAIITLVTFVSLLQGYQNSIAKAQQLFDERLQSTASMIANADQDLHSHNAGTEQLPSSVFFQILSDDFLVLAHSSNVMTPLLSADNDEATPGFKEINFSGYRWRVYILKDDNLNRWVVTGERSDIRYILAEKVVTASIIPIVLAIPVAAFIIWFAIGVGLKPLRELTGQLNNKQADDLSPVLMVDTPEELTSLVTTTNALLQRLNDAFIREQQFSADAAHELRTPISILKVQLHNLQNNEQISEAALLPLASGIERMGLVIEQILSLYRYSPEQALSKRTDVDLSGITQSIIVKSYGQIASKQQKISLIGNEKYLVKGNQFALETLLQNLITNASRYTPEQGEIQLTLNDSATGVSLIVEDSGPGIPQAQYERVFERFYRVDGDRHDSGNIGCGLGLAIVKHIVDLHSAKISLHPSITLGGLKVTIDFPKQIKEIS